MAQRLFGGAIDYPALRIFNRRYLPSGLQPQNCASPNGAIYFHHSYCLADFSHASEHARHRFMHELVG